jgi:hypothetical protein
MNVDGSSSPKTPRAVYEEYLARFKTNTDQDLIDAFNREVGKPGWTSSRGSYLAALHDEFKSRGFDFSAIGDQRSLSFGSKIGLIGKVVKPFDERQNHGLKIHHVDVE